LVAPDVARQSDEKRISSGIIIPISSSTLKVGVVVHNYNPSTQKAEAGESHILG
jgi:hypothetical protein